MLKKVTLIILSVVLFLSLVFCYIYFSSLKNYSNNNIIKAVPDNAFCIMRINNLKGTYKTILNKTNYKKELESFNWFNDFVKHSDVLIDNVVETPLNQILSNNLSVSLHTSGDRSIDALYLYRLKNKAEESSIKDYLRGSLPNGFHVDKRRYNANDIYEIVLPQSDNYYVSFTSGILIVSKSSLLVEKSIRQVQSAISLLDDTSFNLVLKTMGQSDDANLFVNFDRIPDALLPLFDRSYYPELKGLKFFGSWAEFDVNIKDDKLLLNGFISSNENQNKLNQIFKDCSPQYSKISKVIPANSGLILAYTYNKSTKLKNNLNTYLKNNNLQSDYKKGFSNGNSEDLIFELMDSEFALVDANINSLSPKEGSFLVLKTKSENRAKSSLSKLFNKPLKETSFYQLDKQTKIAIYKNDRENDFTNIFKHLLPYTPSKYFSFYNNHIFFANTKESLKQILYANILGKTIHYNSYNKIFSENFASKQNVYFYCNLANVAKHFNPKPKCTLLNPNAEQKEALNNFYGLGIQLATNNNMLYSNICIQHNPSRSQEPQTIWQSKLDSSVHLKPSIVLNHYTKEKEILIQDLSNKVYLITPDGRILWEKKLNKPILSDIYQIDFYKNNKLQYLFNTEDRIYLLDRNGNNVERYPINLSNKATNGLALFDYDKNKNYRIFIATADHKTQVYDKKGSIITGWKASKSEHIVSQEIQHIRNNGNDYIIYADENRNYVLNRRGETRLTIKDDFSRNKLSSVFCVNNKLVTTDSYANIRFIDLKDGNVTTKNLLNTELSHYFTMVSKGSETSYILVTQNKVMIYNNKFKEMASIDIKGTLALHADIYQFSSTDYKIGVYDEENKKIYLINKDGSFYKNFPLKGSSRFSIGFLTKKKSNFNLIVGGENNYLYNYTVQ